MICLHTDFTCLDPRGSLVIIIQPKINIEFLQSYVLHSFKKEVTKVIRFFIKYDSTSFMSSNTNVTPTPQIHISVNLALKM